MAKNKVLEVKVPKGTHVKVVHNNNVVDDDDDSIDIGLLVKFFKLHIKNVLREKYPRCSWAMDGSAGYAWRALLSESGWVTVFVNDHKGSIIKATIIRKGTRLIVDELERIPRPPK